MKIEKYLKEVEEREKAATGGPWWCQKKGQDARILVDHGPSVLSWENDALVEDLEFFAHSRQDIPRLLRIVERLRSANLHAQAVMSEREDVCDTLRKAMAYDGSEGV